MLEQATMTFNPRGRGTDTQLFGVFRGKIFKNGIKYVDIGDAKQVLVDLYMYDLIPPLYGVPILSPKINKDNGEYEDPEADDLVAVSFFGGNIRDPIIIGFVPPADNHLQSAAADAPRSHRKRNGTWEIVDKDGNRRVSVAVSELMAVLQDWLVNVINGVTTIISKGKITLRSQGTVELDGIGSQQAKGVVQGDCICPLIKKPHIMISASVTASK